MKPRYYRAAGSRIIRDRQGSATNHEWETAYSVEAADQIIQRLNEYEGRLRSEENGS